MVEEVRMVKAYRSYGRYFTNYSDALRFENIKTAFTKASAEMTLKELEAPFRIHSIFSLESSKYISLKVYKIKSEEQYKLFIHNAKQFACINGKETTNKECKTMIENRSTYSGAATVHYYVILKSKDYVEGVSEEVTKYVIMNLSTLRKHIAKSLQNIEHLNKYTT